MKKLRSILVLAIAASCLAACQTDSPKPNPKFENYFKPQTAGVQTGGIQIVQIETPKGKFKIWTKRIGNNPKVKLLLLHGGPGCGHDYFEAFESFLPAEGIEFIYYDQLGTGKSDHPTDTSLWDLPRFVEEVEQIRTALNLSKDNFYLLGHSWGGIVAMEYALKYQQNLKGLVISNMMCDAPAYGKYAEEVLSKQMQPPVLAEIRAIEAKKDFQNPRYMELLLPNFYQKHICRIPLDDWPEPINRAFAQLNVEQYTIMQGPSEFGISGKLERWDFSKNLSKIAVPTLVIGATHDTMDPAHMKWMAEQIPGGSFLLCSGGSHFCFYDDQQVYFSGLLDFLRKGN